MVHLHAALTVAAAAVIVAGCSGPPALRAAGGGKGGPVSPAPVSASSSPSRSPTRAIGPAAPEACGPVRPTADGNVTPVFCPDGHPNAAADRFYRTPDFHVSVLTLPSALSMQRLRAAICRDLDAHVTRAEDTWALMVAATEHGWRLPRDAGLIVSADRCG